MKQTREGPHRVVTAAAGTVRESRGPSAALTARCGRSPPGRAAEEWSRRPGFGGGAMGRGGHGPSAGPARSPVSLYITYLIGGENGRAAYSGEGGTGDEDMKR